MIREKLLTGATLIFSGLVLGCGAEPGIDVVPAAGVVRLDGEPVEGVMVSFIPEGDTPKGGGFGISDSRGQFTLKAAPEMEREGVPPGKYRVLFKKLAMPDGSPVPPDTSPMDAGAVNLLPESYGSMEHTKIQATVPSENEEEMMFDLSSTGR